MTKCNFSPDGFSSSCSFSAADQSRIMQDQMTGAAMAMPPDPNKAFKVSSIYVYIICFVFMCDANVSLCVVYIEICVLNIASSVSYVLEFVCIGCYLWRSN